MLAVLLVRCSSGGDPAQPSCTVASVSISPAQVSLNVGETATLTAVVNSTACLTEPTISWSTSNPSQVSIAGNGTQATVTALAPTSSPVSITAVAGARTGSSAVTIMQPPAISLSPAGLSFTAIQGGANPASQFTTISNSGAGNLNGLTVGTISYSGGATNWLPAPTLSGTAANPSVTLTMQPVTGSLAVGSYTATVPVQAAGASNSPQTLTVTFVLSAPATPDLVLEALTAPATGTVGGTIAVLTTVRNQGAATTSAFQVQFYYSTDATITTSDVASGAGCTYNTGLAANTSSDCSGSIPVPASLAPGTYFVGAIADNLGAVAEGNETNNARAAANTTVLSAATLPDLVMDAVTAPTTGTIGGSINVTATVRNQGAATSTTFELPVYISTDQTISTADVQLATCTIAGLGAGATDGCAGLVTLPGTLTPGTYYIGVIADGLAQVTESNESNNARAAANTTVLSAAAAPDLVMDVVTAPATGTIGSPLNVASTVRNQGAATTASFDVGIYLSTNSTISAGDLLLGFCTIAGLGANATANCSSPLTIPVTVTPGTYFVGAIADDLGQITEAVETNNTLAAANTTVLSAAAPDFLFDAMTAPATGIVGGQISVSATLRNQGAATSTAFQIQYYFSTDATITTADVPTGAGCTYATGLAGNTTDTCSGLIPVPAGLSPGSYFVGVIADDLGAVTESNETNNARAAANTTVLTVVSGLPDLVMDAVTAPATGTIGGTIDVTATVRNQGGSTSTSFDLPVYISTDQTISTADVQIASCTIAGGLGAGATSSCAGLITLPGTLTPGTYYVGVIADGLAQVTESNESNNARAAANSTVLSAAAALPDLVMDVVTAPTTGTIGSTLSVASTVRNQGAATTASFDVGIYLSTNSTISTGDLLLGFCTIAGLGANATANCSSPLTIPGTVTPGTWFVGAIADDLGQVTEAVETNNTLAAANTTVLSAAASDLLIDAMTAPATGVIGGQISVSATLRNQGAATSTAFQIQFYYSTDATITTADVASGAGCTYATGLAGNTTDTCSGLIPVPAGLSPGSYFVGVIADDLGAVTESNETNNARAAANTTALSAATLPDFVMDVVTAPATGTIGATINVAATVRNTGVATVASFEVGVYLSTNNTISTGDQLIGSCTITGLGANATADCSGPLTVPVSLAPGTYFVGAIADRLAQVNEGNEGNNTRAAANSTVLSGNPDFVMDAITAPATGTIGSPITVSSTVRNQGAATTASFDVGIYLSSNNTISTADQFLGFCSIAGLGANATASCNGPLTIPASVAPGTYFVGAIADDLNQVAEAVETNNTLAAANTTVLSAPPIPDLSLDVVTAPAAGAIGGTISVSTTVRNSGAATGSSFQVVFYYSTNNIISTADVNSGAGCVYASGLAGNTTSDCSGSIPVPPTLAPGTYFVGAIADNLSAITEQNENNNSLAAASPTVLSSGPGGSPATITINAGNGQTAAPGAAVAIAPSVVVRDAGGAALSGIAVTFATPVGSITGASATTDANGIATLGSWTLAAGANPLSATVTGLTPVIFNARGSSSSSAGLDIVLRFLTMPTLPQLQSFNNAVTRWEAIITGDLADINNFNVPAGACTQGSPAIAENVDDLIIEISLKPIDGTGGVLGGAGPCFVRTVGTLPLLGGMEFDVADLATLESGGQLGSVLLHEMAHVLGVGSLWTHPTFNLLVNPSLPSSPGVDTRFVGVNAIIGFDAVGGSTYTGGGKVPVENSQGGAGTRDSHWRESVLANELMTGFINAGANPLSVLTVRSLQDLGYTVDVGAADPFSVTLSLVDGTPAPVMLLDDVRRGPIYQVDQSGRIFDDQGRILRLPRP